MYELPEYVEGRTYGLIDMDFETGKWFADWFSNKKIYDKIIQFGLCFATRELAQIEADSRNAHNKLMNLAREREKIYPINKNGRKYYFNFIQVKPYAEWQNIVECHYDTELRLDPFVIYFNFDNGDEGELWLFSVMTEQEIKSLCMPRRFV